MSGIDLITPFQREVANAFFGMPESKGFILAGGAALIASDTVERVTEDLDFFAARGEAHVPTTKAAFLEMCEVRNWSTEIVYDNDEFVRLEVFGPDDSVPVDFGIDATFLFPPIVTFLGPTVAPEENAGRKTLALFGRWRPRDFVDVYVLARMFGKQRLLDLAAERDLGFDLGFFTQALRRVNFRHDEDYPISNDQFDDMVAFFNEWADEILERP